MNLEPIRYYDHSKYSDTFTVIRMALIDYFGRNVMRNNLDRVIYASSDYAFRQRLNLLAKNNQPSVKELDLPFMRYYRTGNWEVDYSKPGVQNATAAMFGIVDKDLAYQKVRFLQVKTSFNCTLFFSRDDDAQMAYETLLWIQQPAMKQFVYGSVDYKGYTVPVPIQMQIENPQWMPSYNETEWLKKERIIPIDFTINVRSFVLDQLPQTAESDIYKVDEPPIITKKVIVDFLSYKQKNSFYDEFHADWEVSATFNSDPELLGTVNATNITKNSVQINWDYNPGVEALYTDDVIINVNSFVNYTVPMADKLYVINNLIPGSTYNITVWFTSNAGKITKYTTTATTSEDDSVTVNIKGIIGYRR